MKHWGMRLLYGIVFAIPLMLISYALTYAAGSQSGLVVEEHALSMGVEADCANCHSEIVQAWGSGFHSQALNDPVFQSSWEEQGKPGECLDCHVTGYDEMTGTWQEDGITCIACHPSISDSHPQEPIDVNHSPDLCGDCHKDVYFEWQASTHGQKGLGCTNCHDPHGNQLKMGTASTLCSTCHRSLSQSYSHSQHNLQGLMCTDCHMAGIGDNGVHLHKDHSFFVGLETCNACHTNQLHNPTLYQPQAFNVNPVDAMASVEDVQVSGIPQPANSASFALLAGLVGIGIGVALAPWLEKLSHKKGK